MEDFRDLTQHEKIQVEENLVDIIDNDETITIDKISRNLREYVFGAIKIGYYCAKCFRFRYDCLCSHSN